MFGSIDTLVAKSWSGYLGKDADTLTPNSCISLSTKRLEPHLKKHFIKKELEQMEKIKG